MVAVTLGFVTVWPLGYCGLKRLPLGGRNVANQAEMIFTGGANDQGMRRSDWITWVENYATFVVQLAGNVNSRTWMKSIFQNTQFLYF